MNKRQFLSSAGILSLAALAPATNVFSKKSDENIPTNCVLIPSETAGPFPLDLTENTFFFRQDVRENREGVRLLLKMKILGDADCLPMQNVRVNIWACDKDGRYSGYSTSGNPGQTGLTYCRGYQITDANGEVEFITIFPGWYTGRICHFHFQVFVNSATAAISQLTFPLEEKNALYAANTSLYTKGADPLTFTTDGVFADGYQYQVATLEYDINKGGYHSYLEVTVKGGTKTSTGHLEQQNAKQFILGQNFPNPTVNETVIPLELFNYSNVTIQLFDLQGRMIAIICDKELSKGNYTFLVDKNGMGIQSKSVVYQLEVRNSQGSFKDCKVITFA